MLSHAIYGYLYSFLQQPLLHIIKIKNNIFLKKLSQLNVSRLCPIMAQTQYIYNVQFFAKLVIISFLKTNTLQLAYRTMGFTMNFYQYFILHPCQFFILCHHFSCSCFSGASSVLSFQTYSITNSVLLTFIPFSLQLPKLASQARSLKKIFCKTVAI